MEDKKYVIDKEGSKKNLTGYATIDKPWLKWHDEKYQDVPINNQNYYDYFMQETAKYPNDLVLLNYMNEKKYTREDIIKEVKQHIKMFTNLGVKPGDVVSFMMFNTPEVIIMFLALNKMGAIADLIKFDESSERINKMLNLTHSKYLFISDMPFMLDNVLKVTKLPNSLEKVVVIPIEESIKESKFKSQDYEKELNDIINTTYLDINTEREKKDYKRLRELQINISLENIKNKIISYVTYKKEYLKSTSVLLLNKGIEKTALIVYTGGTTGEAKGVELTNKNLIAMSFGEKYSNYGFDYGKTSMNILPPAIAYYLNATCGLMVCGIEVIQIPYFNIPEYPDLVDKYKPNHIFSGPILFQKMAESAYQFDYLTNPISGGDKLLLNEEIKFNEKLVEKGSVPIQQAYGSTEVAAIATCNPITNFKLGTLGVPMVNINMAIFDYQTDREIPYGRGIEGEKCISGDTTMKGYINNQEATSKALKLHSDGKIWFHTDDFGIMDNDGYIYHRGRAKRMITRSGNKVWLPSIEEEVLKTGLVSSCCAVKLDDYEEREVPILHLTLNKNENPREEIIKIMEYLEENSPRVFIPKYFVIKEELPYTETNKKLDFKALEMENILDSDNFIIEGNIVMPRNKVKKIN